MNTTFTRFMLAWLALLTFTTALIAQSTNTVPATSGGVTIGAFGGAQFYIDVGTLFIGTLLTAGMKRFGADIPKDLLPFLATFIAIVAGGLATVTIGDGIQGPMTIVKTVALALGNVTLRELKDRIKPEEPTPP